MSSSDSHQLRFSPESSISTVPEEYVEHLEFTADPRLQLQVLEGFLRYSRESRGIFKTVDENRELLMCLQKRAPDLLEKCPWIDGWIAGTDIFLVDLMILFGLEREQPGGPCFPRPWPGKFPVADLYGYDIAASIRNLSTRLAQDETDKKHGHPVDRTRL